MPADVSVALPKQSYVRIYKLFVMEERLIEKKVSELFPIAYSQLVDKISTLIS